MSREGHTAMVGAIFRTKDGSTRSSMMMMMILNYSLSQRRAREKCRLLITLQIIIRYNKVVGVDCSL